MFVFEAEFAVDGGEDALYLTEGEHTTQEGVAGVVAVRRLVHDATGNVGEGHAMIHTHGEFRVGFLEDTAEFDEVCPTTEVGGLGEVAIGEDVA